MSRSELWIARIIRLTGTGFLISFLMALGLATVLGMNWGSSSVAGSFVFGISILVSIVCLAVGIPLVIIGDRVSPPDPLLDPWLSPLRGLKRQPPDPKEESQKE